jgi:methyl-accepting chemotaxis protein
VLLAVAGSVDGPSLSRVAQDGFAATLFLPGRTLGVPAPRTPSVREAAGCSPSVTTLPDGVEVLAAAPLAGSAGCAAVVRVLAGPAALSGRSGPLTMLAVTLSVALVVVGVLLAERLGRGLLRSTRDLAATADRIAAGDLSARALPSGPAEIRSAASSTAWPGGSTG